MRRLTFLRALRANAAAATLPAIVASGVLGACAKDAELRLTTPTAAAPFMARYVALGNSITAGYQSGGINDSTQAASYAVLLAKAAGVPFRVPALRKPGCAPPVVDFVTQVRTSGDTVSARCFGRADTSYTNQLNNVAVPNAYSFDPIGQPGGGPNVLTTLILGGRTQVERALDVDPTFATVWIGNNDVLIAALNGTTTGATDSLTFINNYNSTITQLRSRNSELRGVLIGVVDVTNTPLLVPMALLVPGSALYQPQLVGLLQQQFTGGKPIVPVNCEANTTARKVFPALRTELTNLARNPAITAVPLACAPFTLPGTTTTIGAAGTLDPAEVALFQGRVAGWNRYIAAKADSVNFAYYDPNTLLDQERATGQIPLFPNLANPRRPFGPLISNDGVHPGSPAHALLARELIGVINAKYPDAGLDAGRVSALNP
jgi:lysophospholipase L1-like esterase